MDLTVLLVLSGVLIVLLTLSLAMTHRRVRRAHEHATRASEPRASESFDWNWPQW